MPKSKKPRKQHVRKKVSYGYLPEDIDGMRNIFMRADYALLEKLPLGEASNIDLWCAIDAFNTTLVSVHNRKDMDEENKRVAYSIIEPANACLAAILEKGKPTGKFIATGDQLKTIRSAAVVVFPYIDESIKDCPGIFLREFIATKNLCGATPAELNACASSIRRALR